MTDESLLASLNAPDLEKLEEDVACESSLKIVVAKDREVHDQLIPPQFQPQTEQFLKPEDQHRVRKQRQGESKPRDHKGRYLDSELEQQQARLAAKSGNGPNIQTADIHDKKNKLIKKEDKEMSEDQSYVHDDDKDQTLEKKQRKRR